MTNLDDRWRLLDPTGREVAAMPHDWGPDGLGHAVIWGLRAREAAGLSDAVLINRARASRRILDATVPTDPHTDHNLGVHTPL